jgi:hypothetical protein
VGYLPGGAAKLNEVLAPDDMVNRILLSDSSILGILAIDSHGNTVASAWKPEMPEGIEMSEGEIGNVGSFTGILLGLVVSGKQVERLRARGSYGHFESIVINFKRAKILMLSLPGMRLNFVIRLVRSANTDYIHNLVLAKAGILKANEVPESIEPEPRCGPPDPHSDELGGQWEP